MRSLLFVLSFAGAASAAAGDLFTDGTAAFRQGRYADAYALLYPAASSGNAEAKYLVGQMLDQGLAGETNPTKALTMFITAARLGHPEAKVMVERTKRCVMEQRCEGVEAVEVWDCGGRQLRMAPLKGFDCGHAERNRQSVDQIIERRKIVDRYFGDPMPGGQSAGTFGSAEECALWASAAGPGEERICHQGLK